MKKVLFFALLPMILGAASVNAQVKIGSVEPPEKGAILDLDATAYVGGFLLPKVEIDDLGAIPLTFTDASLRGAADAPALAGLLVWNTRAGSEGLYIWDGHDWKLLSGPPAAPAPVSLNRTLVTVGETVTATTASVPGAGSYVWLLPEGLTATVLETSVPSLTFTAATAASYEAGAVKVFAKNSSGTSALYGENTSVLLVRPARPFLGWSSTCYAKGKSQCVCEEGQPFAYDDATMTERALARSIRASWWGDSDNTNAEMDEHTRYWFELDGTWGMVPGWHAWPNRMACF